MSASSPRFRLVVSLLVTVSGALALAHQLLWTRRMVELMGGANDSLARVLGCFFCGLALGSLAGGFLATRVERPWRCLALVEFSLICLSLPIVFLPDWSGPIWTWLGPDALVAWPGSLIKTVLSVLLVLPPAFLMGLFLPLALAGSGPRQRVPNASTSLWLYAANTAGAVGGILAVIWVLLPHCGLKGSLQLVLVGNGLVGATFLWLDTRDRRQDCRPTQSPSTRPSSLLLVGAGMSGFLMLGAEVASIQSAQLLAPLSLFSPAVVLSLFLGLLALAAATVVLARTWFPFRLFLSNLAVAAGLAVVAAPLLFHVVAPWFNFGADRSSLVGFFFDLALFSLLVFGPGFFLGGLLFPLLAGSLEESQSSTAASGWGWLLAANGLGGWLGAETAQYWLLPSLGPLGCLGALGAIYVTMGWFWAETASGFFSASFRNGAIALAVGLGLWVAPALPTIHPELARYAIGWRYGREGSLAILDHPVMGRAMLWQNQYVLGATSGLESHRLMGELPVRLHPHPAHVAFLGVATGTTAGAALNDPRVQRVRAAEISRAVVEEAERWFAETNGGLFEDARSHVVIEDARIWLGSHRDAFDVVVSDLFLPWGPGDGRLYTLEHFRAARTALRAGGLFVLWLPLYQLTSDHALVILRTFVEVFPESDLHVLGEGTPQPLLGVFGWRDHLLSGNFAAEMKNSYLGRLRAGWIQAPINTLDNLWIEWHAGRTRLLAPQSAPYLEGSRAEDWLKNLRNQLRRFPLEQGRAEKS